MLALRATTFAFLVLAVSPALAQPRGTFRWPRRRARGL
jgi:hypothetical protein